MGIAFRHLTGDSAKAVLDDAYANIYLEIRAEPPYNSGPLYSRERFLERTGSQAELPGFEVVAAEDDDHLIGFAFGFTMDAGRWWGGEATAPPQDVLNMPKLAVVELNLIKAYRGRAIGKQVLAELVLDRPEPYATLLSRADTPAHAMYQRWGWRIVGTVRPAPDAAMADSMVTMLA